MLTRVRGDADERATNRIAQPSGLGEGADIEVVARSLSVDQLLVVKSLGLVEQQKHEAEGKSMTHELSFTILKAILTGGEESRGGGEGGARE